jgi:ABC-2 type transport system ATP-binding protein
MGEYILETKNLTKVFGKQKAVDGINMHVEKGAIYGFIGRNGAGKSTTMRIICGLSQPTEGEVSLYSKTGIELEGVREKVGCMIENPGLFPDMTAADNLKLKCIALGVKEKGHIEELLKLVGLENVGKKKCGKFSLGMKQRLGIAMALVGYPDFLVLDEPINGLDPQGIAEVRDMLLELNQKRGITILISSHILEELSKLATHYGIINKGVLVEEISAEELADKCDESIEIKAKNAEEVIPVLKKLGIKNFKLIDSEHVSVYEQVENCSEIGKALFTSGVDISEISVKAESLENYYMKITGEGEE